jgi:hypothetical protein
MRKIAILILSMTVMLFAFCKVGNSRWCYYEIDNILHHVEYGGPEKEIRSLLKNPCEGTSVGGFFSYADLEDPEHPWQFYIYCPDIRVTLIIYPAAIDIVTHNDGLTDDTLTVQGDKADRAWKRAKDASAKILKKAKTLNWNP